jgi:hypothetical protein
MENKTKTAATKSASPKKKSVTKVTDIDSVEVKSEIKSETETNQKTSPKPKKRSTFAQVVATGLSTSKIVKKAGSKILDSSLETTKAIAGIYSKAGISAFQIGKELISETTKAMVSNQKTVRETSVKAFKETVETIKDSNLIENPLKGMIKPKKSKK